MRYRILFSYRINIRNAIKNIFVGGIIMKVYLNRDNWDAEEFWVQMDTTKDNQCHREARRKDRLLPIGHRHRGDVDVLTT
ncbi:MAG TPA: hypothetical protein VGI33_07395 [Paenibacillus sp.]|jgi:hypothetical protein